MAEPEDDRSERELLGLARRLHELSDGRSDLAQRAERLLERIAAGRFHITVVGDFKRGKSTLVNALIGRELLPSGVVPLTAVATEIHFGSPKTEVVFDDGTRREISEGEIVAYVTERENPMNEKGVARVEVGTAQPFGAPGVVLVDTPGAGSANEQNTQTALAALGESDAAVLVLSADSPVSDSEQALIAQLAQRGGTVFVVINRSDHLSPAELVEVEAFVLEQLGPLRGEWSGPYLTDARAALSPQGGTAGTLEKGFGAFRNDLEHFVRDDLAGARRAAAAAELSRSAHHLERTLELESAAGAMDAAALEERLGLLRRAAREGRRLLEEDRVVLDHDASGLVSAAGGRLSASAAAVATAEKGALSPTATQAPLRSLTLDLRDVIERCVRTAFEPVRRRVEDELDAEWAVVAAHFTGRVQERLTTLVGTAEELFEVHLPVVAVPPVAEQPPHFSYQFLTVESAMAPLGRMLSLWLLPRRVARGRALKKAERRLAEELDKHAGRARYDMSQRLEAAKRALVAAMTAEYEDTQRSLVHAAEGARSLLELGVEERTRYEQRLAAAGALVDAVEHMGVAPRALSPSDGIRG